jgi:hypothetical protein
MTIVKDRTVYYAYNVGGMHFKVSAYHEGDTDRHEYECLSGPEYKTEAIVKAERKNGIAAIRAVKEWIDGKEKTLGSEILDRVHAPEHS